MRSRVFRVATGFTLSVALFVSAGASQAQFRGEASPITDAHLQQIKRLLREQGIDQAELIRDQRGRVELQGSYRDEREVDKAFSLAQSVVGVRWVSPVTPQRIAVKEWEECVSRLLSGKTCGPPAIAATEARANPSDDKAPGPIANKYALVAGVGKFKNRIQPLQYANKDAYEFYRYLVDPHGGNFKSENVVLLRDEYATRDAVKGALTELQRRAQEDDLVVLYVSSHGTPPDKFGGVHIVTYDAEVQPRERIWETALTEKMLSEFIQQVRAKRLIILLDACYSNGAYAQIAGFLPSGGKSLEAGVDEGYGRSRLGMAQRLLGAKDLVVEQATPSAQSPSFQVPNGWGKVLISASDAGERSWESDQLQNSVFTHYFIDGLRRYRGAIKDSFEYAKPLVKQQVKQEKGQDIDQTPQLTPSRKDWNLSMAVSGR